MGPVPCSSSLVFEGKPETFASCYSHNWSPIWSLICSLTAKAQRIVAGTAHDLHAMREMSSCPLAEDTESPPPAQHFKSPMTLFPLNFQIENKICWRDPMLLTGCFLIFLSFWMFAANVSCNIELRFFFFFLWLGFGRWFKESGRAWNHIVKFWMNHVAGTKWMKWIKSGAKKHQID